MAIKEEIKVGDEVEDTCPNYWNKGRAVVIKVENGIVLGDWSALNRVRQWTDIKDVKFIKKGVNMDKNYKYTRINNIKTK